MDEITLVLRHWFGVMYKTITLKQVAMDLYKLRYQLALGVISELPDEGELLLEDVVNYCMEQRSKQDKVESL